MTKEEAIKEITRAYDVLYCSCCVDNLRREAFHMAIQVLDQEPIDKSAMLHEIYMEGVNMSGEYQGCWVRFKDIEKIVDKYIGENNDKRRSNYMP